MVIYLTIFGVWKISYFRERREPLNTLIIGTVKFKTLITKKLHKLASLFASQTDLVFDVAPSYKSEEFVGSLQLFEPWDKS